MLYPLSYEGITGFRAHTAVASTTSAQHPGICTSQCPITHHYSSTWADRDEQSNFRSDDPSPWAQQLRKQIQLEHGGPSRRSIRL